MGSWNWPFARKDMEVYGATGYASPLARISCVSDQRRTQETGGVAAVDGTERWVAALSGSSA